MELSISSKRVDGTPCKYSRRSRLRLSCKWCHQADARLKKGFLSNVLGAIFDVVVARSGAQHGWLQLLPAHQCF